MTSAQSDLPDTYFDEIESIIQHIAKGKYDEALVAAESQNKSYPEQAEPYLLLGVLAYILHDRARSVELFETAHKLAPDVREYADALANILALMGRAPDSLYYAKLATVLEPHTRIKMLLPTQLSNYFKSLASPSPSYHYLTARGLYNVHKYEKCANHCEMELRTNPDHHAAHDLIGRCFLMCNDPVRARRAFQSAIHFSPETELYKLHLAESLAQMGLHDQAITALNQAREINPGNLTVLNGAIALLHTFPAIYAPYLADLITAANGRDTNFYVFDSNESNGPKKKINIGYIGGHFDIQNELVFIQSVLKNHDRNRFAVHLFFNCPSKSSSVQYLETLVDSFTQTPDIDDDTLFTIIHGNSLDVLIDLDGVFAEKRSDVLAGRAAKYTLCWPSSKARGDLPGVSSIDTFFEQSKMPIVSPITREPILNMPDPSELPATVRHAVTFGATAVAGDITNQTIMIWSRILHALPNAQLLLSGLYDISSETATLIAEMFNDQGLSGRVAFHRHSNEPGQSAFGNDFFENIDIFLDTIPSSSPDLLSEALWMGVPTVTAIQDNAGLRSIGAHVLTQAGKEEWIAATPSDYEAITLGLASDLIALSTTRSTLRKTITSSNLFSPRKATNQFENAIAKIITVKAENS